MKKPPQPLTPAVTFTQMGTLKHRYYDQPRIVIMANVPNPAAYAHVEVDDAERSGLVVPPKHDVLLLPHDLQKNPPLESLRPQDGESEIMLPLGFVPIERAQKVCFVFGALTAKPETDRVKMYDDVELGTYVRDLNKALKADPEDGTGIGGLLGVLNVAQRFLTINQQRCFPPRSPHSLH